MNNKNTWTCACCGRKTTGIDRCGHAGCRAMKADSEVMAAMDSGKVDQFWKKLDNKKGSRNREDGDMERLAKLIAPYIGGIHDPSDDTREEEALDLLAALEKVCPAAAQVAKAEASGYATGMSLKFKPQRRFHPSGKIED